MGIADTHPKARLMDGNDFRGSTRTEVGDVSRFMANGARLSSPPVSTPRHTAAGPPAGQMQMF
jgi:hypothetical protein